MKQRTLYLICPICGKSCKATQKNNRAYLRKHNRLVFKKVRPLVYDPIKERCPGSGMEM